MEATISDFFRNVPLCVPRVIGGDLEPCWSTYTQNELGRRASMFASVLGIESTPTREKSEVLEVPEEGTLFPKSVSRVH